MKKKSKKSKKILMKKMRVIAVFVIVIVAIILLIIPMGNKETKAMKFVDTYISYINEAKYEEMYNMITSNSKGNISQEDFINKNKGVYGELEASNVTVYNMSEEEENRKNKNNIHNKDEYNCRSFRICKYHKARAKSRSDIGIIWTPNVIFPGLNETDTLKIDMTETSRGNIYDRNGKLLAGKGRISTIGLVPGRMSQNKENDIREIAKLLNITEEEINAALSQSYVKENTFVEIAKINEEDKKTETELMKIAGIKINTATGRVYPYGEAISSLIGYTR